MADITTQAIKFDGLNATFGGNFHTTARVRMM